MCVSVSMMGISVTIEAICFPPTSEPVQLAVVYDTRLPEPRQPVPCVDIDVEHQRLVALAVRICTKGIGDAAFESFVHHEVQALRPRHFVTLDASLDQVPKLFSHHFNRQLLTEQVEVGFVVGPDSNVADILLVAGPGESKFP